MNRFVTFVGVGKNIMNIENQMIFKLRGTLLLLLGTTLLFGVLDAQSSPPIRLFGDIRIRGELDMRDFNQRTPANAYTLMRSRMGVEAKPAEDIRIVFQIQDSRVFGQEKDGTGNFNTLADSKNLDLHQGFVEIRNLFISGLMVRLGRQELSFGNERLIGSVGWHNVGRAFDGVLFRWDTGPVSLNVLGMNVAEVHQYAPIATPAAVAHVRDAGSDLIGIYGTARRLQSHDLEGYALYQSDRNQTVPGFDDLRRWTLGGHCKGKESSIEYEFEVAYQAGSRRGQSVSSYLLTGSIEYGSTESHLRKIGIGYDVL